MATVKPRTIQSEVLKTHPEVTTFYKKTPLGKEAMQKNDDVYELKFYVRGPEAKELAEKFHAKVIHGEMSECDFKRLFTYAEKHALLRDAPEILFVDLHWVCTHFGFRA